MSQPTSEGRRALVLRRADCDSSHIERLAQEYGLDIVYTVVTDTAPQLAALIAVHPLLESDAEAIVVPHLTRDEVQRTHSWRVMAALAVLVTTAGVIDQ